MNAEVPRFLPERLRPPTTGRKRRRGFALLTVVPVMLLALPRWQVTEVRVEGCPKLPTASVHSLHELVGQPAMGLDLEAVRDRVEIWPGVGEVEVELELPGTVHVRAAASVSRGSLRVGRSWHGVAADGSLTGLVDFALPPVLAGFTFRFRTEQGARRRQPTGKDDRWSGERNPPRDAVGLQAPTAAAGWRPGNRHTRLASGHKRRKGLVCGRHRWLADLDLGGSSVDGSNRDRGWIVNEHHPVIGIDLGSSKVSVVVGEMEDERLVVRGCGQAAHDGARKGVIASLEEVSQAVRVAAEEAEAMASIPVEVALVGIGGLPIQGVPSTASVPVTGRDHTVTSEDLQRALAACAQVAIPEDYRVLDIISCGFALDGQSGMDYPVGMPGNRLDASAYVLYANRTHAETVEQAVNHAAVALGRLVFEPLAASEAVLTQDEKELGCLLLDMGYATTDWVLFAEGVVALSGAVPIGGRHFTADLAAMLKTTTAAAERSKRQIGAASQSRRSRQRSGRGAGVGRGWQSSPPRRLCRRNPP